MTRTDLDDLETAPATVQLAVLLRAVDNLRWTAIETTQVWLTVAGKREELRSLEAESRKSVPRA